jgi:cell fate regulator YaaT (PSP1 superfamily)
MAKLAIRFRPGEIRVLEPAPEEGVAPRDYVVYELEGGLDCRPVTMMPNAQVAAFGPLQTAKFIRKATPSDMVQLEAKTTEEAKAHAICAEKIAEHRLPMKLVDAIYTLDFSRLTFLYTSDGRVDFRELLKDLTSTFKRTRILLRQIGVRDEAKHLSGVGSCGKELCCSTFLKEFAPINIKLAKEQDLSLNPSKLSGACGRLKCCLSYEVDAYREMKASLPKQGARVLTAFGEGRVIDLKAANERCLVELSDGRVMDIAGKDMNVLADDHPGASSELTRSVPPARPARSHRTREVRKERGPDTGRGPAEEDTPTP